MNNIYIPTEKPEDWKPLLAEKDKHWRKGYSAKTLAHCWEEAEGFPKEISNLFKQSDTFKDIQFLMAFPEHKVSLPGGGRASQNDIFVLARTKDHLVSITVEGKVNEPFGPILKEWKIDRSEGKQKRLEFIKSKLGLSEDIPDSIRYQLLHRTVSAVIEAEKFHAKSAIMLVHSFTSNHTGLEDYKTFLSLYNVKADMGNLYFLKELNGINLYSGWVEGNLKYLKY